MVGDRPHLVGIAIDITDRLQAEASVRASERKYRNLVENAPLGIIACDLQGQISSVNRILLEVLGSPSAAATSEINVLTFPPLVEAGIADRIRRCMDKEESSVSEHLYHTKWGRSVYMRLYLTPTRDANGAITGAQGIVEDTTERVQAEQARRESEERLQLSLQAADLGLWSMDVASATFVVNSHWARILGYPPDRLEYTADRWQALTHPDDLNRVQEAVSEHVHQRTPSYQVEYRFRSGLGEWEWISARGKVVEWSDDGQPLRMAGTHLLITESRRTEQELRQYRDHLEELVQERTTELRRAVNLMAGREVRMAELKETIRQLHAQLVKAGIVPIDRNMDSAGAIESENNFSSSKESRGKETIPNP
jgi:PAS domain S-box-containing protein